MFLAFSAKAEHGMFHPGFTQPFAKIIPSAYLLQLFSACALGAVFPDAAMLLSTSLFLVFGSVFPGAAMLLSLPDLFTVLFLPSIWHPY